MLLTTSEAISKYTWMNRQNLHYAATKGLKFKKKIIQGRAVNVYKESDLMRYFERRWSRENSRKIADAVRDDAFELPRLRAHAANRCRFGNEVRHAEPRYHREPRIRSLATPMKRAIAFRPSRHAWICTSNTPKCSRMRSS